MLTKESFGVTLRMRFSFCPVNVVDQGRKEVWMGKEQE